MIGGFYYLDLGNIAVDERTDLKLTRKTINDLLNNNKPIVLQNFSTSVAEIRSVVMPSTYTEPQATGEEYIIGLAGFGIYNLMLTVSPNKDKAYLAVVYLT